MEERDYGDAVQGSAEEVKSKTKDVGGESQKEEKLKDCLLIIHIFILLLKITVDNFPFALYYVELYDRYEKIRRAVRRCLAVYPHNDAYRNALSKLDRVLTSVIEDERIKSRVKVLKADYKIFGSGLFHQRGSPDIRFSMQSWNQQNGRQRQWIRGCCLGGDN